MLRSLLSVAGGCLVLLAAGGCANYQLGTGGAAPGFRTLHVETVKNQTLVPQAPAIVSTQIRDRFARDARVQLANSPADADAVLSVVLTGYRRDIATVREGDTGLARKFNETLEAKCTLRDQRTGKVQFENRPVSAVREVFTDSGQLQAEYQTLPLLAETLAAKITHLALDAW
jgi:hypothetical protein